MNKILVGVKKPGKEVEFIETENKFENLKRIIGCSTLEVVYPLGDLEEQGIIILADENGKITCEECNFWLYNKQDCLNGTAIFVLDDEDDWTSIKEEHKEVIREYLKQNYMPDEIRTMILKRLKGDF